MHDAFVGFFSEIWRLIILEIGSKAEQLIFIAAGVRTPAETSADVSKGIGVIPHKYHLNHTS